MSDLHAIEERQMLAHLLAMGGWVKQGLWADDQVAKRLVLQGLVEPGVRDRRPTWELTRTGRDVAEALR